MISVEEAKNRLRQLAWEKPTERIPLEQALNRQLSTPILAPQDDPPFDKSAVDGYALGPFIENQSINIIGEHAAGDQRIASLGNQQAIRIFTGAPVPEGAHAVIMQEQVRVQENQTLSFDESVKAGQFIRPKGGQVTQGALVLAENTLLSPAGIGLLAGLGINEVEVFKKTQTSILLTGNEFATSAEELQEGKIFDANGPALSALLSANNCEITAQYRVEDTLEAHCTAIQQVEKTADIIFISGGVSVGDYDFTRKALEQLHYEIVLHGVAQKPGKPFLVAQKDNRIVFGLPGNPRSALCCVYAYALPFLHNALNVELNQLPLEHDFEKPQDNKTHWLSATVVNGQLRIVGKQESHLLQSLAQDFVLIQVPDHTNSFKKGTLFPAINLG